MPTTVADLIKRAKVAAQNQALATATTKAAVAQISAQRGATGRTAPIPAAPPSGGYGAKP